MERKLGEIFTYNGKIYQVVKGFSCKGCAFIKNGCCDLVNELLGPCDYTKRTDKTNIIFKEINNMEIKNNQLTIDIPEGMEIDLENSDLAKGIVKFKKHDITYRNIEDALSSENYAGAVINDGTGYTVTKITPGGKCIGIYQFNADNTSFLKYYKICSQSEWESAIDRLNIWFKDASLKIKKL